MRIMKANGPLAVAMGAAAFWSIGFAGTHGARQSVKEELGNRVQEQTNRAPSRGDDELDVSKWQPLKNKYGWQIKYPKDWYATSNSDSVTAKTSSLVEIGGPKGCPYAVHQRCALIQIDAMAGQGAAFSNNSIDHYLGFNSNVGHPVFSERNFVLGGLPAGEVTFLVEAGVTREIAVKHEGKMLTITYLENTNIIVDHDKEVPVKSPADWKFADVFDKVLSNMSFYNVPKSVWPKP